MKNINQPIKYVTLGIMAFALMFVVLSTAPTQAHACIKALGFLDPLCVIKNGPQLPKLPGLPSLNSNNSNPQTITNSYTNSNNINSNINSPGSNVNVGNTPAPTVAYTTPVYNYDYYSYNQYPQQNYGQLQVSCYPMPLSARTGDSVSWVASAYGGNNAYYYTWTGTDGLSGYGSSIRKTYYSSGYKSASVSVTSGGQTVSKNCDGTVNVYGDTYYNQNYYPQNYNYYSPLSVTCNANNINNNNGNSVTWNAYPSGGNGSYSYSWSGTDGIYGSNQSVYFNYSNPGSKYAYVTVYSNGQSITQACGTVNVGGYGYNNYNNNNGLDVACYSDPTTARINQPATWRAEVTGGVAPYTYSWTGTNGLSGSDSTLIKYYDSVGEKSAIVTIKSTDGRTATRACSTALTIRGAGSVAPTAPTQPAVQPAPQQQQDNGLSAAALFSLKNVPWGWVAILVILVLFATVVYLIFNRPKI